MSSKAAQKNNAAKKVADEDIDMLLNDFGRGLSGTSSVVFYGMALVVAVMPCWIYWRIHMMDPMNSALPWAVVSLLSAILIAKAYTNTKFVIKHKVAQKIEKAVSAEVTKMCESDQQKNKYTKSDRENMMHWKKNQVCESQAVSFSLFFNNILYLTLVLVFSFFILKNFSPIYNYIGSVGSSAGILFLLSTSSK